MKVQNSTTSTETTAEHQETTTSTNNNETLQYQQLRPSKTVGGKNKKHKIEQYFTTKPVQQNQHRTSTNAENKKTNNSKTTQKIKELEKMKQFMSKFKISKDETLDKSLPIQVTDGSASSQISNEESPGLMTSARQQGKSENRGFAKPANLVQSNRGRKRKVEPEVVESQK